MVPLSDLRSAAIASSRVHFGGAVAHLGDGHAAGARHSSVWGRNAQGNRLTSELWRSADLAVALAMLFAAVLLTNPPFVEPGLGEFITVRVTPSNVFLLCAFVLLWPLIFALFGVYDPARIASPKAEALHMLGGCATISATTLMLAVTGEGEAYRTSTALLFLLFSFIGTLGMRHLCRLLAVLRGSNAPRQILIVGSGPRAFKLFQTLTFGPPDVHEVVGFVDLKDIAIGVSQEIQKRTLGTLDQLESILMRHRVDEVLIALPIRSCYGPIQETIATCERIGIESRFLADLFQYSLARPEYEQSATAPVIALKVVRDDLSRVVKRAIDVVGAGIGLILLAPVFLILAVVIKVTSPGPVFFSQDRFGYRRRLFRMYKFRTMRPDAEALQLELEHLNEAGGPVFKIREDPRVTRIGRFLRRTSLDELPQLLNVLKGDMSLVGPRPLPRRDVGHFKDAWLLRRFSVPPGLTCLWQISGRSDISFDDWVALDLDYIDRWSLRLDLQILWRTIPAVVRGTGAA